MNPVALQLGPISIRWYAICIVSGLILAVYLSMKEAPRKKIDPDAIIDFILIAFPLAIVGARLYYVIFEWGYYSQHLGEIFAIWNGGIAIYGGLLTGALVLYLFSRRRLIEPIDFLDIAAPSVMVAQSIGRWGNFFNHEAFGSAVSLKFLKLLHLPQFIINNMYIEGAYHHPTFLYESVGNLIVFLVIIFVVKKKAQCIGEQFFSYFIGYGIVRFFVEGLRTDSLMLGPIRMAQLTSIVFIVVGVAGIYYLRNYQKRKN